MLQFCERCRGAISVFLTLILIPTFIFSGVMIDGSRILSAKNLVSGAGDLSMNAALSNYNAELNKTYGLLAMADTPEEVDAALQDFFEASLNASGVSEEDFAKSLIYLELVDDSFQATGVDETQIYQTKVIKQEILEYMKYRAPVTFVDRSVLSRLEELKEAKKEKEAARAQTDYESSLDDLQELFDKIKEGNDCNPEHHKKGTGGTDFLEKAYKEVYDESEQKDMLKRSKDEYETIAMRSAALWRMNHCQEMEDRDTKSLMKLMVELADSCNLSDVDAGTAAALIQMVYVKNGMAGRNPNEVLDGVERYKHSDDDSGSNSSKEETDEYKEMVALIENYADACEKLENGKKATAEQIDKAVSAVYEEMKFQHDQAKKAEECCDDILDNLEKLERELEKLRGKYETWDKAVDALKEGQSKEGYKKNKEDADALFGPAEIDNVKGNLASFKTMVENSKTFYGEVKEQLENVTFTDVQLIEINRKEKFIGEAAGYTEGVKTQAQVEQAGAAFMERYFDGGISLSVVREDISENQFVKDLKEKYCKREEPDPGKQKQAEKERNDELETQMEKLKDLMLSEKVKGLNVDELGQGDIPSAWLRAAAESVDEAAKIEVEGGLDGKKKRKKVTQSGMDNLDKDDDSLNQVSDLFEKLSEGAEKFAEPVILTEYVIGMFSCYTSDIKAGESVENPKSISRDDLTDNALYLAEVEYILWGSPNAVTNVSKTKALIFTINLIFNMTFAFTNGRLQKEALTIAAWFPVGALAKTAIKCALQTMAALGETVKNMVDLMDGKRVPLVKLEQYWDTWLLSSGSTKDDKPKKVDLKKDDSKEDNPKEDNPAIGISYEEYLWIFVCINMFIPSQQEKLLARTADCIELNVTDKKSNGDNSLKDMYTMLEVEAKVKVDTFFLPKLSGAGYGVKEVDDETFAIPYKGIQGY